MTPEVFVKRLHQAEFEFQSINDSAAAAIAAEMRIQALKRLDNATHGTRILHQAKVKAGGVPTQLGVSVTKMGPGLYKVKGQPGGMYSWLEKGTQEHFSGAGRNVKGFQRSFNSRKIELTRERRYWNKQEQKYVTRVGQSNLTMRGRKLMAGRMLSYGPIPHHGVDGKYIFSDAIEAVDASRVARKVVLRGLSKALW